MQLFADLNKNSFGLLIHDLDLSKLFYENRQNLQEAAIIDFFISKITYLKLNSSTGDFWIEIDIHQWLWRHQDVLIPWK